MKIMKVADSGHVIAVELSKPISVGDHARVWSHDSETFRGAIHVAQVNHETRELTLSAMVPVGTKPGDFLDLTHCDCGGCQLSGNCNLPHNLYKLSPRNGDIVFFDSHYFDAVQFAQLRSPSPECDDVIFVPVRLRPGQKLADTVKLLTKEEVSEIFGIEVPEVGSIIEVSKVPK